MTGRRLFRKGDVLLLAALVALALLFYTAYAWRNRGAGGLVCEISVDGKVTQTLPLSEDCEFVLPQNPHIRLEVRDGAVGFTQSDCPDQICVHTGFLRRGGQTAVCLPNRVAIRVVAVGGGEEIDSVVQ